MIDSLIENEEFVRALREIQKRGKDHSGIDISPEERGDLSYSASLCLYNLGRYKEALLKAKSAYHVFKSTPENKRVAQIQHSLGMINMSLGDLKNAELHLRDAISIYRRLGDRVQLRICYNRIAHIYFIKCEFDRSIDYLGEAKALCDNVDEKKKMAIIAGNLGTIYALLGEWQKAEENLQVSFAYHQSTGDEANLCLCSLSLGFVSYLRRDFQRANSLLLSANGIAQKNNYHRELAVYHEYMGSLCFDLGKLEEAESHYNQILDKWEETAPEGDMISQTYRLLAELQVAQRKSDQALESCQKSLKASISLGEKIEEGAVYRILGQIHSAKGDKKESCEYFEKGISLLQKIGAKYELARTYLEAGWSNSFDYYRRLGFLSNAESLFRYLNSKYHLGLVNLAVSDLLARQKDYDSAQVFLAEAARLFKESKDEKELRQVRDLKDSIDDALSHRRMIAKYNGRFTFDNVVTQDTDMREIIERLKQVMDSDLSILLEGETGTGKDLVAKAIHYSSERGDKRFVAVNCAALPESLLENELFGHKKGAYTGADKDQPGLFEEAVGGTLYLDQVEEIPMTTQVKLLRAIEEKEVTRLGEAKPRKIDVNIVSSSIVDLKEAARNGKFRQDLYFRLNTFKIRIPPLRERKQDIPLLVKHFLKEYKVEEKKTREFERNGTLERFLQYEWPGNIRELDNEMKRIAVLAQAGDKNPFGFLSDKLSPSTDDQVPSKKLSLSQQVDDFQKERIVEALTQCKWIKLRAARLLGIPEGTLRSKMKKYKISTPGLVSENLN
jgi:DNA-binding NtrC family response regulator